MSEPRILLRYNEIALKGGKRGWFEDRLAINAKRLIQRSRGGKGVAPQPEVTRGQTRLIVHAELDASVREALSRLFGISSFSPMRPIETSKESLIREAQAEFDAWVARHGIPRTFRVQTRRSEKALPERAMELDREIGSLIKQKNPGLEVSLDDPELSIGIEIRQRGSLIWTEKIPGLGGLPVGSNGKVLALMSGGIDSPVAAIQALRRGASVSFIHFYGAPFVGEDVLAKVEDLVRIVNRYQPDREPLFVVPFGKIQERVALATSAKLRTVLYRRLMIRIACAFAKTGDALALVTGESIGQVASQTLENLSTINQVSTLPILRPLITRDKDEIVQEAKRWGTYEPSIRPGIDCCTLFADRHPMLRSTVEALEAEEARIPVDEIVAEALASIEIRRPR